MRLGLGLGLGESRVVCFKLVRIILFDDDNDDQSTCAAETVAVRELLDYLDRSNVASGARRRP